MAGKTRIPLDVGRLLELYAECRSVPECARSLGLNRNTLQSKIDTTPGLAAKLRQIRETPVASDAPPIGGAFVVSSTAQPDPGDIDRLLRDRDLDPAQWVVTSATVNEWQALSKDSGEVPLRQIKARVEPLKLHSTVIPARSEGNYRRPAPAPVAADKPRLVAFLPDQHCPHHDPALHVAACRWLRKAKPSEVVLLGDLLDLPKPSRHRETPEFTASVQECVNSAYAVLRDYVACAPKARFRWLPGNHDYRIRIALIEQLRDLYGLRRAGDDGEEVLSLSHLLRLDELGVEFVVPVGEYAQGQLAVTPKLAARHGWIARQGSGTSALKTLEHLGYSVVVGHTHRQSVVYKTTHDIDGRPETLTAVEAGTMAKVRGGLAYAIQPDWQAGFATAWVWPDGRFRMDLATWVGDTLLWRDERFDAVAA